MAELRHIVVSGGPFCSFSNFEFFVLRSGAYEYLYGNFRECSSFIFRLFWRFPIFNRSRGLDVAAVFLRQFGWGGFRT